MGPIASSRDYKAWHETSPQRSVACRSRPSGWEKGQRGLPEPAIVHSGPGQVAQREARQLYRGERGNSKGERKRRMRRGGESGSAQEAPSASWGCSARVQGPRRKAWNCGHYLRPSSRGEARAAVSSSQLRPPAGGAHAWPQPQPLCTQPRHAIFPTSAPPWPDLTNPCRETASGAKEEP